jgi:hypothetical protein
LALTCRCGAGPESEAHVLAALASLPRLAHLELLCGPGFQPQLSQLPACEALRSLALSGSRETDDAQLASLPAACRGLTSFALLEQGGKRG